MFPLFLSSPDFFKDSAQLQIFIGLILRICWDESWLLNIIRNFANESVIAITIFQLMKFAKSCNSRITNYQLKNYLISVINDFGDAFSCIFILQIQNQKLLKMYLTRPFMYVCILLSENNFHVYM